jgi:DNA-binding CsgD family transcriptional regulator
MEREGYHHHRSDWQPSASQRRILDALLGGQTNAEIAVRLRLSPETVKWHISELLAETGFADRHALASWWRSNRSRHQERRGLFVPAGALRFAPLLVALLVAAVTLRLVLPSHDENRASEAASPPEEPTTATESAVGLPSSLAAAAWVFDIGQGTAQPVPVSVWAAQWYEPGKTLLAKAGTAIQVIVDLNGKALAQFAQEDENDPYISIDATALYGSGALLWRWRDRTLSRYDSAADAERLLLTLQPSAEHRHTDFEVSPDRTRIAYTQVNADTTSLIVADMDGGNQVTLLSRPARDEVYFDGWSPDGSALLVFAGTRKDCRRPIEFDLCTIVDASSLVLDLAGNVLWQQAGTHWQVQWAGPDHLLIQDGAIATDVMAARGLSGICEPSEILPGGLSSCIHTVRQGETLAEIAAEFGVDPDDTMMIEKQTSSGWLPLAGQPPEISAGDVLSLPAPLQGSLLDLSTGQITVLPFDVHDVLCVSPDGKTAIVSYAKGSLDDFAHRFHLTAIDLATGATIIDTQVANGLITCTDKSWTPDGSQVVLSSWGK